MKVLVVDVGGLFIKVGTNDGLHELLHLPSGPEMTAARMMEAVKTATAGWSYDVVALGYPGPVARGRPAAEPHNLPAGWRDFDYEKAFGKPLRLINDGAMQALGSYEGGRMLFLGLGTGLGSALVVENLVLPLELAHLPYRDEATYEDYVGVRGYERLGHEEWQRHVHVIVALFQEAMQADYVVIGGGNAARLERVPPGARLGGNVKAIAGGARLWEVT